MEIIKMKTKALSLSIRYFMMELNQRSIQAVDLKITNESSWDITILKIEITIKKKKEKKKKEEERDTNITISPVIQSSQK